MEYRSMKEEVVAEMIARYDITQREAENRWRTYIQVENIGSVIAMRRRQERLAKK